VKRRAKSRAWALGINQKSVVALTCLGLSCSRPQQLSPIDVSDASDMGRALGGETEGERQLLKRLSGLPSSAPQRVGATTVVAEPPYTAASGRTCRALHLTIAAHTSHKLACRHEASWFFVPDVFGATTKE
jgi:hypothetical protein